ncbi:MAG: class I SAM-dependent methyltransferase [Kiritimatiellae bacterium]|nr:class I SAM-dependent methyltransferase [Kiritimatiellia bacterium]
MAERIKTHDECAYWDALADTYQAITRISCRDFHYGPQIPGERRLRLLPPLTAGMTALELGCGAAQYSVWLAKQGLHCVAMDVSKNQLAHAAALVAREAVDVRLVRSPIERFHLYCHGQRFDFIHSSHALEFVQRPGRIIKTMASFLRPGGHVMVSTVHPLYNGSWVTGMVEDDDGQVYDGQFLTDYFEPPDDVRDDNGCRVISRAYPVSSWFAWFRAAGLEVTALAEPKAVRSAPYTSDDWADHGGQLDRVPSTVILIGRKGGGDVLGG